MKRPIWKYTLAGILIICIGWPSRLFQEHLPDWYTTYCGDFLWAGLVYLFLVCLFSWKPKTGWWATILLTYAIEFSQLFHPAWLNAIRDTLIGRLALGYGFLWSDLVAYTLGISLAAFVDLKVTKLGATEESPLV